MSRTTVFLAFGANLGKRREQIEQGIMALKRDCVDIVTRSSWFETEPVHMDNQPWFLNLVVQAETSYEPHALLAICQNVEKHVGRVPSDRFGPRHLDIDILLYGDLCIETEDLTIPHPRIEERRFVLVPLVEIAPELRSPNNNQRYADVLSRLGEGKKVLRSLINES